MAFFGNLYLASAGSVDYGHEAATGAIRKRALNALEMDWRLAPYHGYVDAIEAAPRTGETPNTRIDLRTVRIERRE